MRPISLCLFALLSCVAPSLLVSCAGGPGTAPRDPNKAAYCCLYDPEKGHRLMPESPGSRASLDRWAERHGRKLQNGKPRFLLLAVSPDLRILDRMPICDQKTPKSKHALSSADCAELRACFSGGHPVAVNLASGTVTAP